MGDHDDDAPALGHRIEVLHDASDVVGIQTRRRLIEEEYGRLGEQFDRSTGPSFLTARKVADAGGAMAGEAQLVHDFGDPSPTDIGCKVGR